MAFAIPTPHLILKPEPLTASSFAAFGTVISSPLPHTRNTIPYPPPQSSHTANQNTALKYPGVSPLISTYRMSPSGTPASPHTSLFACFPRKLRRSPDSNSEIFDVNIFERHPYTTQTFLPLTPAVGNQKGKFIVIVAPSLPSPPVTAGLTPYFSQAPQGFGGLPDLGKTKVFLAEPGTGVTYGVGVWHAPMVVIGEQRIDFVVSQWMSGREWEDVQEVELGGGDGQGIEVLLDGSFGVEKAKL